MGRQGGQRPGAGQGSARGRPPVGGAPGSGTRRPLQSKASLSPARPPRPPTHPQKERMTRLGRPGARAWTLTVGKLRLKHPIPKKRAASPCPWSGPEDHEPGQGAEDVQRDLGAPGGQLPHPCGQGRPCPRPHTWAGGPPDLGRSWGAGGEKSSSAWGSGPPPCPAPAGPLRVGPDQPGLGAPHGLTERSSSLHHGPREGVSCGPGLLQPEVLLTPPGCRAPPPISGPWLCSDTGAGIPSLQGPVASFTGRLGGDPARTWPCL